MDQKLEIRYGMLWRIKVLPQPGMLRSVPKSPVECNPMVEAVVLLAICLLGFVLAGHQPLVEAS
jgi:hypothetical protein